MLEKKPYGLAFHSRGRPQAIFAEAKAELETRWRERAAEAGLALEEFDGGIELRPAAGDKGDVVAQVLEESGSGAAVAYLGDDRTDEDAFAALRGRGLPVLVRQEPRPTHAKAWIRPPEELLLFLKRWRAACSDRRA